MHFTNNSKKKIKKNHCAFWAVAGHLGYSVYMALEKNVPFFCPELPIFLTGPSGLVTLLLPIIFSTQSPTSTLALLEDFSPQTLFSKYSIIFVIFWDISHFQSILQKAVPG